MVTKFGAGAEIGEKAVSNKTTSYIVIFIKPLFAPKVR